MITNDIFKIEKREVEIPLIVRSNEKGWVPGFESWNTKISDDTSYISCNQTFGKLSKEYSLKNVDHTIGYTYDDILVIKWKSLVDTKDLELINKVYNGKLRACTWKRRYCTYYTAGTKEWLHAALFDEIIDGYVVHHINGVSSDNRRKNLHKLHKIEHDSINHPELDERKIIFSDPKKYFKTEKEKAISAFINEISLILTTDNKNDYIAAFAKENLILAKEILEIARYDINLSGISEVISHNRLINPHLEKEYLDAYEINKYLKKTNITASGIQLRMF